MSQPPYGSSEQPQYSQPAPPGGAPYGGGGFGNAYQTASQIVPKGFFGALFDLSFSTFVTPKLIKFVYVLGLIAIALFTLILGISGFLSDSPATGILTLLIAPLIGLLYLCLFRMACEFYLAISRMSEDIHHRLPGGPVR